MKNRKKEVLEEIFNWWITFIPDKIFALEEKLPENLKDKLDFSVASLEILEKYLLENYTLEGMMQDEEMWDYCASYIGYTYKKNIFKAEWHIDLNDKNNIFYNMPCLHIPNLMSFVPHSYVTALLSKKENNLLSSTVKNHINLQ